MKTKRYKLIQDDDEMYCVFDNEDRFRTVWKYEFEDIIKMQVDFMQYDSFNEFELEYPEITILTEYETIDEVKSEYPEYFV